MKGRFNLGNACCHSFLTLSFHLLSKNVMVNIYKIIISTAVLCGCETWSLIFREGHRLQAFENGVLRKIFGPNVTKEAGKSCLLRSYMICTPYQMLG
jgi:hypothetical protein